MRQKLVLSSHPGPGKRAVRLELKLQGKAQPLEEVQQNFIEKITGFLGGQVSYIIEKLKALFLGWKTGDSWILL